MSSARLRHAVNEIVARSLPAASPAASPAAAMALDTFDDELERYAELILAPAGRAVGFMTRGEDAGFTERVASVLRRIDMPPAALEHHRFLAEHFEHERAFFKVEWHLGPDGQVEPVAACSFRCRPELETVLAAFQARDIATGLHDELRLLAYALEKRTVHFTSAAFRRGAPVHHELCFSQYLAAHTRPVVAARLERVVDRMLGRTLGHVPGHAGAPTGLRDLWRGFHAQACEHEAETTLFVSVSLAGDAQRPEIEPGIKIAYPDITPALAAAWAPAEQREQVLADASWACQAAGRERLSFLGVRLRPDQEHPALEYYADLPDRSSRASREAGP